MAMMERQRQSRQMRGKWSDLGDGAADREEQRDDAPPALSCSVSGNWPLTRHSLTSRKLSVRASNLTGQLAQCSVLTVRAKKGACLRFFLKKVAVSSLCVQDHLDRQNS